MGAHAAPLARALLLLWLFSYTIVAVVSIPGDGGASDAAALLKFKAGLSNPDALGSWNKDSTAKPCNGNYGNWIGVLCFEGNIWGLQLENMGLSGEIDVDSLLLLPHLRTLSFMNNNFEGPFPDFKKLGVLKSLYLSNNQFSGTIPADAFAGMGSLKKSYLSNNNFGGNIPASLANAPKLIELRLDGNQFEGLIPDFKQKDLKTVNVSNNQLEGPIPSRLVNFNPTSFSGNKDLCGKPLDSECKSPYVPNPADNTTTAPGASPTPADASAASATSNSSSPSPSGNNKFSPFKIVIFVICCAIALAAIIALLFIYRRSAQTPQLGRVGSSYNQKVTTAGGATATAGGGSSLTKHHEKGFTAEMRGNSTKKVADQHIKLTFVRDDRQKFDLQDLLRASAEVLGSGNFGSSYKAVLMDGQAVVVKRFKQMNNVSREEFHEHMRRIGRLSHPNLLPLVAYYYRKEEKLLVFDYVHNGSLASQLHGNHTAERPGLNWPARLKIVKGVAKGLAYLHNELPSLIVPHGHLKSSNVLLDKTFEPLLMDYTLIPVVNIEHAQQILVAYKAPEYAQNGRTTKKTDVWSLGILILEILTGKFPAIYLAQGTDVANWINSIVREDIGEVFDKEMGYSINDEGEMVKLLKIGIACCEEDVGKRLDLKEVVEQIEELKEMDSDVVVVDL